MLAAVSRAPLEKPQAYKQRMGSSFPWASSFGSDFNYDFAVSFTEGQQLHGGAEYYLRKSPAEAWKPILEAKEGPVAENAAASGTDPASYLREAPGMSAFALEDGAVTAPTRPTRAGSTRCGACTSGSTARRSGGTRTESGSAAATNMTATEVELQS